MRRFARADASPTSLVSEYREIIPLAAATVVDNQRFREYNNPVEDTPQAPHPDDLSHPDVAAFIQLPPIEKKHELLRATEPERVAKAMDQFIHKRRKAYKIKAEFGVEDPKAQGILRAVKRADDKFFPAMPLTRNPTNIKQMSLEKRKQRWLQSYNASYGNESRAMYDAQFTRDEVRAMLAEPEIAAAVAEIRLQIQDRVKYVLFQRIGLVPGAENMPKISEQLLMKTAVSLNKEIWGDDNEGQVHLHINIPRPAIRAEVGGGVPSDGEADRLPYQPG